MSDSSFNMTGRAKRWLRPWLTPLREFAAFRRRLTTVPVGVDLMDGRVNHLLRTGDIVSAHGWCGDLTAFERALRLRVGTDERAPSHVFRVSRPELERVSPTASGFRGAVAEWVLDSHPSTRDAALLVHGRPAISWSVASTTDTPYGHLHTHGAVLGRGDIYAFGPPVRIVSDEILYLARSLPAPVLDYGCGAGALVRALRNEGIEAYGIELDEERIHAHLIDEVRPFVTVYDGRVPCPFPDRRFASVVCSEVLEHMPDPAGGLAEMARLASQRLLITVPDMSAIPRGYVHGVVPWHLLESTHVNFFTQHSLDRALAAHATHVEFSRIGLVQCERLLFYGNLVAMARLD